MFDNLNADKIQCLVVEFGEHIKADENGNVKRIFDPIGPHGLCNCGQPSKRLAGNPTTSKPSLIGSDEEKKMMMTC